MIRTLRTTPIALLAFLSVAPAACSSASSSGESPPGKTPTSDGGGTDDGGKTADGGASSPTVVRSSLTREAADPNDVSAAADANNAFGLALYKQSLPMASGGNWLTSPISADLALTMAYAGAQGTTASQMASVLHVPSGSPSIFDAQNALTQALATRGATAYAQDKQASMGGGGPTPSLDNYELQVVNEVWGETGYPWESPFLDILAESYGTGVYATDFKTNAAGAETAINQWVSTETDGLINPLLPLGVLNSSTRMVLVNAIHLKLPWLSSFDVSQTQPATFTRGDGSTVQTPFMNQMYLTPMSDVGYAQTSAGQFVSIPLYGDQVSVVFALPTDSLAALDSALTTSDFNVPPAPYDQVYFSVPKFNFETSTFSLATSLQALGMTDAFNSETADFKGQCATTPDGYPLYIADVLQRATLDVTETGVQAAAATAVIEAVGGAAEADAAPPTSISITLDKPFLVAVVDTSGAILFLGQIDDPTNSGG